MEVRRRAKDEGRQGDVLVIASAAYGIRLAAGSGTDDVRDRIALQSNVKSFDDGAYSE
jgi:hypothetical protein